MWTATRPGFWSSRQSPRLSSLLLCATCSWIVDLTPRQLWLMLLELWLVVVGLAAAGALVTRAGERIAANEGLLVLADLMVGLLVISASVGRATRRLSDDGPQRLRVGSALEGLFGRAGPSRHGAIDRHVDRSAGWEIALAAELPGPPAVLPGQDCAPWILAPANGTMPPVPISSSSPCCRARLPVHVVTMALMSGLPAGDVHDVIHHGGEVVAVVLPIAEYQQLRQAAEEQRVNEEFGAARTEYLARRDAGTARYVSHEEAGRRLGITSR
jgi:hypothetical protein